MVQYPALFLQGSNEDVVKELVHRPHYIICRVRVQVHQVDNTGQCQAEVRAGIGGNSTPRTPR